ncbi:serine hydrolase [Deinococcus gobiensis]|uniref:Beta lactamase-related protein n=1 Tax=Deinococcus gobiensis (strain DSM 21396 / JCM 16679 / CGMCC 1.7299 / I-0) TaxID=745776 RepID=H8GSB8_DEIGI|nr:serine hydrolase [Deinococcus gobiensis]AFD25191.1 Beta lactamase-related protein [Deinococcus gobiensis I-0]
MGGAPEPGGIPGRNRDMHHLTLTALLALPAPALAQTTAPAPAVAPATARPAPETSAGLGDALTRLFAAPALQAGWFAPDFLAQVPLTAIEAQFTQIRAAYGAFVRLDTSGTQPVAVYERGALRVTAARLDDQGRLTTFGAAPAPVRAAPDLTQAQLAEAATLLTRLFSGERFDPALFDPAFLAAVPAEQLDAIHAGLTASLGAFVRAEPQGQAWVLVYERGTVPVLAFSVNAQGLVTGLRIGGAVPQLGTLEEARAAFAELPGQVSVLVREVGQGAPLLDLNAGRLLAVGSTFKLAILGEVQAQVRAGRLGWDSGVQLTDALRSLPSGTLQDAPAGAYPVSDLAARMIRDSDNTATDLLLNAVGREGVEARLGQRAIPSTRELFALKNPANAELLRAYRAAGLDAAARRAVLAQAATAPLPARGWAVPTALDVEWYVNTDRLCRLMADVAGLDATQLEPGVATPGDFARVSYKGGSEPGVLNLTTQITTKAGRTFCVSATWNRPEALDETRFLGLYAATLRLLR